MICYHTGETEFLPGGIFLQDKPFISLAMLTRESLMDMIKVFKSFIDKADNINNIECIVGLDHDDLATISQFQSYQSRAWPNINFKYEIFQERVGWEKLYKCWNKLYEKCEGEWIIFCSDDCSNITEEWDKIIKDKYKGKFAHIKTMVYPSEMTHPDPIAPVVCKKFLDILGHVGLNTQFDKWLGDISRDLGFQVTDSDIKFYHVRTRDNIVNYGPCLDRYDNEDVPLREKDKEKVRQYLETLKKEK